MAADVDHGTEETAPFIAPIQTSQSELEPGSGSDRCREILEAIKVVI